MKAICTLAFIWFLHQVSCLTLRQSEGVGKDDMICGFDSASVYLEITKHYLELRDIHSKVLLPGAHQGVIAAFLMINKAWSSGDIVPCVTRVTCYLMNTDNPPKPKKLNPCTYQMELYQRCPDVISTTHLKDAFRVLAMEYKKTPALCPLQEK